MKTWTGQPLGGGVPAGIQMLRYKQSSDSVFSISGAASGLSTRAAPVLYSGCGQIGPNLV